MARHRERTQGSGRYVLVHHSCSSAEFYHAIAYVPENVMLDDAPWERTFTSSATSSGPTQVPRAESWTKPNLDSFEAVMQAMDAELPRISRRAKMSTSKSAATDESTSAEMDIEEAMDAELQANLDADNDADDDGQEHLDYKLIKNFLESFKNQAGMPGPVSNLSSRLHPAWGLPRDA